jgi:hypothetical protein
MNDTATTAASSTSSSEYTQFVWRRFEEPLRLGNWELPWQAWVVLLGAVLAVALFYVVWMYVKDSKGIGVIWASLLGFLRLCVYAVLALVFLLPAKQTFIKTTSQGKVLVLFDVSDSTQISDMLPTGRPNEKLTTRMEQVLDFIGDKKVSFIANLEKKNPVTVYRFGRVLDPDYIHFADGRNWSREEREKPARDPETNAIIEPEPSVLPEDYWRTFLTPRGAFKEGMGLSERDQKRLEALHRGNVKAVKDGLTRGTNLYESALAALTREHTSRIQGIILFTDGRNNEGGAAAFRALEERARLSTPRIPIFVVGVGEDRQKVKININELRLPTSIQPDDKFRAVADVTGEGLAGQKLDVTLEVIHVRTVKTKTKGKDGKVVEQEKEELLPIEVIEAEHKEDPKAAREKINLGTRLLIKPPAEAVLDRANPPRVNVEWQLDAIALAAAAKIDLTAGAYAKKKWEIAECKEDSELKFVVRVPVDPREGVIKEKKKDPRTGQPIKDPKTGKEIEEVKKVHESDRSPLKVIKKPIRVLLATSAANHDYQFVRTLLFREMEEKKTIELAVYFQKPPDAAGGVREAKTGVVQDVPGDRLLRNFPDTFGTKKDLFDLSSYDVIVAFDLDWKQLTTPELANLKRWADKGGGLVMIGGHINTVELIRPKEGLEEGKYQPLLELLPVVLADRRVDDTTERKTDDPYALVFDGATPEMEFLRLDEELDESKFKQDWEAFFYGTGPEKTPRPQRGFYNFYPVQKVKTGAITIARFSDPQARLKDNTLHPYIVMNPDTQPRVLWIGSAETWRLREYREEYHERFWTKLVRFAAAKSKGGAVQSIRPEFVKSLPANRYMQVDARIDGSDGNPLERGAKPQITLKMPPGVSEKEINQGRPVVMSAMPGTKEGWFSARFQVRSPGEYEMTIRVPKDKGVESDMFATGKFTVTEANPELDNTRPDFDRMYRLASEADVVIDRMGNDADRALLKRSLIRPRAVASGPEAADTPDIRDDKQRLYFTLKTAELIPSCMLQDVQTQTSLGRVNDLWNEDVVDHMMRLAGQDPQAPEYRRPDDTKKFSTVLIVVVLLFSLEWLIRKLLRLA